jgi:hypothetical protein
MIESASTLPDWAENIELPEANSKGISEEHFDMLSGAGGTAYDIFPPSLIVPIESSGSTFKQYNENAVVEAKDYVMITPRPPVFTAGEYMITAGNKAFIPITSSYFYPIIKYGKSTYGTCKLCGGTKIIGFTSCLRCLSNPGYIEVGEGELGICPICDGNKLGVSVVCPSCGEDGKSYSCKCGTCGYKIGKKIGPRFANPRYKTNESNGTFTVILSEIVGSLYTTIYMNNVYVPATVKHANGEVSDMYTIEGDVITFNYMIFVYNKYKNGHPNIDSIIDSIEVYKAGDAAITCNECKITFDADIIYNPGYVYSPTDTLSPPKEIMYKTNITDVSEFFYKNYDLPSTPSHEGFTTLGAGLYLYNEIITKSKQIMKYIAGYTVEKYNSATQNDISHVINSVVISPLDNGEVEAWKNEYGSAWDGTEWEFAAPWIPWTGAKWEPEGEDKDRDIEFWNLNDPEIQIMLLSNLSHIGQVTPDELSAIRMPAAIGTAEDQSRTYLNEMLGECRPSGYASILNEDNIHRTITIRDTVKIKGNNDSEKLKAVIGTKLDDMEGGNTESINPTHNSVPVSIDTGNTIKVGNLLDKLINVQDISSVIIIQQLIHGMSTIAYDISNLMKKTSIQVIDGAIIPAPTWIDEAPVSIEPIIIDLLAIIEDISSSFSNTDGIITGINNELKAIIKGEKPIEAIVESAEAIIEYSTDVIFYTDYCIKMAMYRQANSTVFYSTASGNSYHITVPDECTIRGLWYYNMRKTYMLWISSFTLLKSIAEQIFTIICSFKYAFLPKPVKDIEGTKNPTKQLDVSLFTSGESICYPILEEDIEIDIAMKETTIPVCGITNLFGSNSMYYNITGKIAPQTELTVDTIPLLGIGAADEGPPFPDFVDGTQVHKQFIVRNKGYENDPGIDAIDTKFDYLRNTFSSRDYMIRKDNTTHYLNETGDGIETIALNETGYTGILTSINKGGKAIINKVEGLDFTGKIDCSTILPYLSDIRQALSPTSPVDIDFKSGMPYSIGLNWTETEILAAIHNITTNPTKAISTMNGAANEIQSLLSNKKILGMLYDNPSSIKFIIPFLGFADASISSTNDMCESALMAYVFHTLGFVLKDEYLSGGIVNEGAIASSIGSIEWANNATTDPDWKLNYNLFLSKRRAYVVALYTLYKLISRGTWTVGEYTVSISTTPVIPPHYYKKIFHCYGFGSMFGNSGITHLGSTNELVKAQRTTYVSKMIPTLGVLPVTGISENSICLTAPIGRDITGDVTCMSIIGNNTIYTPMVDANNDIYTHTLYNKTNSLGNLKSLYNNAAGALLKNGESSVNADEIIVQDIVLKYASGEYPVTTQVLLNIGDFISGAFNQNSPVYTENTKSPFKTTTSVLDDIYLNIQKS